MQIDVRKSTRTGRLVFQNASSLDVFDEVSGEYFMLFPIAVFSAISLFSLLRLYEDAAPLPHFLPQLFLLFALTFVLLFTYLAIRRNRKLIRIATGVDQEANRNLSLQVIDSIGWSVIANRKAYAIAVTPSAFIWCGQEITVVYERGGVYLNCRNRSVRSTRSPYLFGKGDLCVKRFREELESLLDQAPNKAS